MQLLEHVQKMSTELQRSVELATQRLLNSSNSNRESLPLPPLNLQSSHHLTARNNASLPVNYVSSSSSNEPSLGELTTEIQRLRAQIQTQDARLKAMERRSMTIDRESVVGLLKEVFDRFEAFTQLPLRGSTSISEPSAPSYGGGDYGEAAQDTQGKKEWPNEGEIQGADNQVSELFEFAKASL